MTPAPNPSESNAILVRMSADLLPAEDPHCTPLAVLIQRMAAGDEAALGRLYDLALSRVYALALRITGRRDLAEEVCIETFWQSWREAARFDMERGQPMAWLMMMTRTRALDALRRLDRVHYCADPESHIDTESCPAGSPLDQLLVDERADALRAALVTLTPVQRQLVALAFYRDLSHQEISDQTGLPLGTVKSHLKRAQDSLRGLLSPA